MGVREKFGRYILIEPIGEGGMGVVYRAFDPVLKRNVAVKLLRPERSANPNSRLIREAQSMAKVSDPSVVQVYDTGVVDGSVFIAMELIDGMTLSRWLRAEPRTWSEILDHFLAAGRGLATAHAANVIHRDFKPSNVLVSKSGRVLVGDFGLATPIDRAQVPSTQSVVEAYHSVENENSLHTITLTKAGQGTPRYMAPEQRDGRVAQPSADQYSFCVALTEALRDRGAPEAVLTCARRGLALNPAARFATMDELLAALQSARASTIAVASGGSPRRWLAAGAAALGALGLIAWIGIASDGSAAAESESPAAAQVSQDVEAAPTPAPQPVPVSAPASESASNADLPAPAVQPTHAAPPEAAEETRPKKRSKRKRSAARRVNRSKPNRVAPREPKAPAPEVPDDLIRELWTTK